MHVLTINTHACIGYWVAKIFVPWGLLHFCAIRVVSNQNELNIVKLGPLLGSSTGLTKDAPEIPVGVPRQQEERQSCQGRATSLWQVRHLHLDGFYEMASAKKWRQVAQQKFHCIDWTTIVCFAEASHAMTIYVTCCINCFTIVCLKLMCVMMLVGVPEFYMVVNCRR